MCTHFVCSAISYYIYIIQSEKEMGEVVSTELLFFRNIQIFPSKNCFG